MRIYKSELAGKIGMLKNIVPKKSIIAAIQGVLVADGYLIANNLETGAKVKLEAPTDEPFIIPARAFDLIGNLPNEMVEIKPDGGSIIISVGKIKNKFATVPEGEFPRPSIESTGEMRSFTLSSEKFLRSIKKVSFAISPSETRSAMNAMCLRAKEGRLNYIGMDGRIVAWDRTEYEGEFELLIPKGTIEKLSALPLEGDLTIEHNENSALFVTDECEVSTRLVAESYFDVERVMSEGPLHTEIQKRQLMEALTRAKLCLGGEKSVIKLGFSRYNLEVSTAVSVADYNETLQLSQGIETPLDIGFDVRLLLECLKAFDDEEIRMNLTGPRAPMIMTSEHTEFVALILPVMFGGVAV